MNTNYSSLRTVANIFTVFGWIQIVSSVFVFFLLAGTMQNRLDGSLAIEGMLMTVGLCLLSALLSCFWFAIAQFIKLCINAATQIENIDNNLYIIASKIEKANP